jgi:hypothetical protein
VARARAGTYRASETQYLPGYSGKLAFSAPPALRACVRFEVMALLDKRPPDAPHQFDVIFCRNVLIYLEAEHLKAVWKRLMSSLAPSGVLAVAPVESLTNLPDGLVRSGPLGWLERSALQTRPAARRPPSALSQPPTAGAPARSLPQPVQSARSAAPPRSLPPADLAAQALDEVARHLAQGDAAAAEQVLQRLLSQRDDAFGWFLLGEACVKRGAHAQARVAFQRASVASLTSGDADLETVRAAALRRAKQLAG